MAECVISAVVDTDLGRAVPACVVHASHAPCQHNGEPACATPLHTDLLNGRMTAVRFWQQRTRGQRQLVLHRGRLGVEDHDTAGTDCWCGPEVLGGDDDA